MHRHPHTFSNAIQVLFLTSWAWGCVQGTAAGSVDPPDGGALIGDGGLGSPPAEPPPPPPCARDLECRAGTVCIDGACAGDPLAPPGCSAYVPCPLPLACGDEGVCGCGADADCPPGFACAGEGTCGPGTSLPSCAADADCEDDAGGGAPPVCVGGACVPGDRCVPGDAAALVGTHRLVFHVPVRDALPDEAAAVLDAVAAPFRVLAGDGLALDLGLPGFLERLVAQLARAWAERRLEPWHRAFLGLVADADDLLSDWRIEERVRLDPDGAPWRGAAIAGTVERRLSLRSEERLLEGAPEDVLGAPLSLPPPRVAAACGRVVVDARAVEVPLGALVVWLLDRLVEEASDGRHRDVDEALAALASGFCEGLGAEVGGAIGFGVGPVLADACREELDRLRRRELEAVRAAGLGRTPVALRGLGRLDDEDPAERAAAVGVTEARVAGRAVEGAFAFEAVGAGGR